MWSETLKIDLSESVEALSQLAQEKGIVSLFISQWVEL